MVNISNAELKLLLSQHRGEQNAGNGADLLVMVELVKLMVLLMAMTSLPLVMVYSALGAHTPGV